MSKIALITGASQGIGLTLSNMLLNKGYKIIGIYNNTVVNKKSIDYYKCNISNEEDIKRLFEYIKNKYKKIDILVNCAAISIDNDIYEKSKSEFMKVLEINVVGPFLMCKYLSKIMDKGIIINIASTDGIDTYSPISMDYSASKAALINLTENLALRFPKIRIYGIAPNWVDTDSTLNMNKEYLESELKRVGQNKLIKKEDVTLKIINIIENDNIKSGSIIRMDE